MTQQGTYPSSCRHIARSTQERERSRSGSLSLAPFGGGGGFHSRPWSMGILLKNPPAHGHFALKITPRSLRTALCLAKGSAASASSPTHEFGGRDAAGALKDVRGQESWSRTSLTALAASHPQNSWVAPKAPGRFGGRQPPNSGVRGPGANQSVGPAGRCMHSCI